MKHYLLYSLVCLLASCTNRMGQESEFRETDSYANRIELPSETIWIGSDSSRKVILMLNGQEFELYGVCDDDEDGVLEYAECYTGAWRMHNDTISITEKESGETVTAILNKECMAFLETDSTESFTLYRKIYN